MKSTLLASILALVVGAGCQKSTDLAKMQAESLLTIKPYADQIKTLEDRHDDLEHRITEAGKAGPSLTAPATLEHAKDKLVELKKLAANAPAALANAAKGTYPDEEIIKTHDEMVEELVNDLAIVKNDLAATETWLATSGSRVAMNAPPAPTPPTDMPPPPTDVPPPAPATPPPAAH
jgi:hypothetical protein